MDYVKIRGEKEFINRYGKELVLNAKNYDIKNINEIEGLEKFPQFNILELSHNQISKSA